MERAMGIEPTSRAWEAPILPLNYARSMETLAQAETADKGAMEAKVALFARKSVTSVVGNPIEVRLRDFRYDVIWVIRYWCTDLRLICANNFNVHFNQPAVAKF